MADTASNINDFLFQGTPPSSWTATATERNDMPAWYQAAQQAQIMRASQIANTPYETYQGPRIAGTTPLMDDSYNGATMYKPKVQANFNAANDLTQQGGQGFNQDEFSKYLNPATSGIVDRLGVLGARNLSENLLPQVNDTFTGAGQFGGSRHADFTLRALRDQNESTMAQQNSALQQAYDSAMGNYQTGQNRTLSAGAQMGNLGAQLGTEKRNELGLENTFGQQQQGQDQSNLALAYQDFLNQQNQPLNSLSILQSTLKGTAVPTTRTAYNSIPLAGSGTASPAQTGIGALASIYGQ